MTPSLTRPQPVRRLAPALLAILLTFAPAKGPAQAQDADVKTLVHRAGELTWLRETADVWRGILMAQSAAYSKSPTADAATKQRLSSAWEGAVGVAFNSNKMAADVEEALSLAFKPEELKALMAFYDTDLGRRFHAAEQPHPIPKTADTQKDKSELVAAFRRLRSDRKRRDVIARISAAMGGVDAEVDALAVISGATAYGMMNAMPDNKPRLDQTQLDSNPSAQRARLRAALEPLVLPSVERRYARFTLAELKAYAAEMSSPLAQRFAALLRAASNEALRRQGVAIGHAFAKRLTAESL